MSRLSQALKATIGRDVIAAQKLNLNHTKADFLVNDAQYVFPTVRQYKLRASFEADAFVEENQHEFAREDLRRAIVEEVFGEFRPMIIEMRTALYDHDTTRMRKLLAEMEHKMFNE